MNINNYRIDTKWLYVLVTIIFGIQGRLTGAEFQSFLNFYCVECHDNDGAEAGLDLSRFSDDASVMADRSVWRLVYDKLESKQMPPPKQESLPTDEELAALLSWIEEIATRPDPLLGVRDPGKPILRRLTRLEYNNALRDLFGLKMDLFMFPERLPIADKGYFQPEESRLESPVKITMREYGSKYPVLCPPLGLPGDNRAEHGYRNRGDAMDFSPVLLEKYLVAAREILNSPDLPIYSDDAAELFGIDPQARIALAASRKGAKPNAVGGTTFLSSSEYAPKLTLRNESGSREAGELQKFRESFRRGFANSTSVVFDGGDNLQGASILPGKGGLMRIPFADSTKNLTINPNADIWIVGFSTSETTSGGKLFCNHKKGEKVFELTFKLEDGDEDEGIEKISLCVLGRKKESGSVTLTVRFTDGTETTTTVDVREGVTGTQFVQFISLPGEAIRSLLINGSKFSGDYVLLDDLAFITNGRQRPIQQSENGSMLSSVIGKQSTIENSYRSLEPPAKARDASIRLSPQERLAAFIARAFRRKVSDADVRPFILLLETAKNEGMSDQNAMREALAAVLASPQFLYLEMNGLPGETPVLRLEDAELASRLAFFLWASTPDDRLLELANAGRLHDPIVFEQEVRRMLRDPKSRELSESFAMQWLRLDQLYTSRPDRDLFKAFYSGPQGKSTLHGAMLTEALLLFETVHVEDRSILDFIAADYTWLNPGLAKLYGVPFQEEATQSIAVADTTRELKTTKEEVGWRRVALPQKDRGGFITMAAPMVVTSLPFRTSPVKRGAWLLETIFNRPPTEPKVAFAIENDTKESAMHTSIRRKFEAHRNQEACYSCHVRLDPPGFALERFDPIGRWRDNDGNQTVDAKGDWQGFTFDGPADFKAILVNNPNEFTRGFIEHMLSYALGRELQIYDMPTVSEIQKTVQANGFRFRSIVVEIAKSYPFTHVRSQQASNSTWSKSNE